MGRAEGEGGSLVALILERCKENLAWVKGNLTYGKPEAQTEAIVALILERCEPKAKAEA